MWITTRKYSEDKKLITVTITADSKEDLIEGMEESPKLIKEWIDRTENTSYNER